MATAAKHGGAGRALPDGLSQVADSGGRGEF